MEKPMSTPPTASAEASQQLRGDQAYEQLRALLDAEMPARGTRLPGELALAQRFQVSRPVLRQALARLRAEGRIYSRKGSGNYVGELSPASPQLSFGALDNVADLQAFLEYRLVIESECAARAAAHRHADSRRQITQRRRQFERAIAAGLPGIEEDIAFHGAIAQASNNRFLAMTLAAIATQSRFGIRLVRDLSARPVAQRLAEVCREHAAIEAAICAGDAQAARAAMAAHLAQGIERLFGK
jgi:DNA-binding FadR family transcriptional regulator